MARANAEPVTSRNRSAEYKHIWRCLGGEERAAQKRATLDGSGTGGGSGGSGGSGGAVAIEMQEQPLWMQGLEDAKRLEAEVASGMNELRKLHHEALKPRVVEDTQLVHRIEMRTAAIHDQFKQIHARIKEVVALSADAEAQGRVPHDQLMVLRNVKMSLVNDVNEKSQQFRRMQRYYLEQVSKQRSQSRRHANPEAEDDERQAALIVQTLDAGFTEQQLAQVLAQSRFVDERNADLQGILHQMIELNQLFLDMNQLVIQQGTMLDRIDYLLDEAHNEVMEGNEQLKTVAKSGMSMLWKAAFIFILILIIGFTFALILKVVN